MNTVITVSLTMLLILGCQPSLIQPYKANYSIPPNSRLVLFPASFYELTELNEKEPTLAITKNCVLDSNDIINKKLSHFFENRAKYPTGVSFEMYFQYVHSKTSFRIGPDSTLGYKQNSKELLDKLLKDIDCDYAIIPVMIKGFAMKSKDFNMIANPANQFYSTTYFDAHLKALLSNLNYSESFFMIKPYEQLDIVFRIGLQVVKKESLEIVYETYGTASSGMLFSSFERTKEAAAKELLRNIGDDL